MKITLGILILNLILASLTKVISTSCSSSVIELTDLLLNAELSEGNEPVFIRFYASWWVKMYSLWLLIKLILILPCWRCPDCEKFTPKWHKVAERLNATVRVADFDCAVYHKICRSNAIKNYPTFVWVDNGKIIDAIPKECSGKKLVNYALDKCALTQAPEDERQSFRWKPTKKIVSKLTFNFCPTLARLVLRMTFKTHV